MESFEFLGGRYNRPEQIMPGPVQAFRAQNAANSRTVFVHRVSTTEAPTEQAALLKLLTTALVKSSDVKRLVLDFGEEGSYWYVVTESEPQCALLREWLQLEIDAALAGSRPFTPSTKVNDETSRAAASVKLPAVDPGEFTRFIEQRTLPSSSSSAGIAPLSSAPLRQPHINVEPMRPLGEFSKINQSLLSKSRANHPTPFRSIVQPSSNELPQRLPPGEFSSIFNSTNSDRKDKPQPPVNSTTPVQPISLNPIANTQPVEAGEFTKYFMPGLPAVSSAKPAISPSAPLTPSSTGWDRTPSNHYVQRPNTPIAGVAKSPETGEFSKIFSRPESATPPPSPPTPPTVLSDQRPDQRPDELDMAYQSPLVHRNNSFDFNEASHPNMDLSDQLFDTKLDVGQPVESQNSQQGEFTKLFGVMGTAAPAVAAPAVVAAPKPSSMLDEHYYPAAKAGTRPPVGQPTSGAQSSAPAALAKDPPESEPSEYSRISQGGSAQPKSDAAVAPKVGDSTGAASPLNIHMSPINPLASMPMGMRTGGVSGVGNSGGSVGGVHGNLGAQGPSMTSSLGSANLHGAHMNTPGLHVPPANLKMSTPSASGPNLRLVLFLSLVAILAVVLVLVFLFMVKTK